MMKKYKNIIIAASLVLSSVISSAMTYTISVEDNEFDPAILNVNVGDTLVFIWDEGVHTTTSVNIPAGAQTWDNVIDQSHPVFIYIPTVAGSYDYHCNYHSSMGMLGHFTVYAPTSINEPVAASHLISGSLLNGELKVIFKKSAFNRLEIMSLTGTTVKKFISKHSSVPYTEQFDVSDLIPGIYILHINNNDKVFSSRIIKE